MATPDTEWFYSWFGGNFASIIGTFLATICESQQRPTECTVLIRDVQN